MPEVEMRIILNILVLSILLNIKCTTLQNSIKFWSTAWGEIKLEGKFVLYLGAIIPNDFKCNISKGLMGNLYQNRSHCIFNRKIIFVVDRNRSTFLLISIIVNFLVIHVAFSWRKPTVSVQPSPNFDIDNLKLHAHDGQAQKFCIKFGSMCW